MARMRSHEKHKQLICIVPFVNVSRFNKQQSSASMHIRTTTMRLIRTIPVASILLTTAHTKNVTATPDLNPCSPRLSTNLDP